jgi:SAM-dependent methyltransferase
MRIVLPAICLKYAELQCNNDLAAYENCPELESVKDILKKQKPKNVLEIGAGLGRVSVFLNNWLNWKTTNFYLLDGNSGNTQIAGMHETLRKDYYNSIEATKVFCTINGIKEDHLFLIDAEKSWKATLDVKFDLCYSFKSMGFHWPITPYLVDLYQFMNPGAYLIFEMRSAVREWYNTDVRWNRAKRFIKRQVDSINKEQYKIVTLQVTQEYPVLVLQTI